MYIDSSDKAAGRFALNAANADTADKLNTSAGSTTQPVYFSGGKPVALSTTIGANDKPVFVSGGTITASNKTVGANNKFVYMSNGTITASTQTAGSASLPVYLNAGAVTACTASSLFNVLSWTGGTTTGPTISITVAGQNRTAAIPAASASASGIVTTGTQTFAGAKTFSGAMTVNSTIKATGTITAPTFSGNLSGNASTATRLNSLGVLAPETERNASRGGVYTYNTNVSVSGGPTTYTSIIGFGQGANGHTEIASGWTSGRGLWYRNLRDTTDNWFNWYRVLDESNYSSYTVTKTGGGASGTWSIAVTGNAGSATKLSTSRYVDGVSFDGTKNVTRYATCATAAATAEKTASVTAGTFSLITGARVTIKFTYANSAASPTLNVGSTGAKAIYWHGAALTSSQYWQAGAVLDFVYNGTQWDLIGVAKDNNTTYSAASSSAAGLMSASDKAKLDGIATGANNYTYTLPAATGTTLGGVKVGSNISVSSGTISLTKANVTAALGYTPPTTDTNTHYTTRVYAGLTGTNSNSATSNPYIKITDDNTYRNQIRLVGSGATSVSSDASGNITISSTNTDTHYVTGLKVGASAAATANAAASNGSVYLNVLDNSTVRDSHKITGSGATSVTSDANGVITISSTNTTYSFSASNPTLAWGTTSTIGTAGGATYKVTMPANPNTDYRVTNTAATTTKAYITGTTSSSTNTGTQVFDTNVYLSATAGELVATKFTGALNGNANTATRLVTARSINGTSFDGSGAITTANWGTARTITIGSTGKSVNGSGNVSWSLSEIGAAAASHTHSYLPLSGGTLSGVLNCFGGGLKIGTSSESVSITYDTSSDTLSITFP